LKINEERICVVGAGLVGTLLSLYLAKRGYRVDLYEKRPDMRHAHISAGRSIVMSISARGVRALEGVGQADAITSQTLPKRGRTVHMADGTLKFQRYGKENNSINTIDRRALNCTLMDKAEATGKVKIFFNQECGYIDIDTCDVEFLDTESGEKTSKRYSRIVGTDGIFSSVRANLEDRRATVSELTTHPYGYRELVIPPLPDGDWAMEHNSVHIWPRPNIMMLAIPRIDHAFTITLFLPLKGENSFCALQTEEQLISFFKRNFPKAYGRMPTLVEDYFTNDTASIFSVRCSPWHYKDKVAILGDASHAIVPFFAMGMNAGFEDCTVFDNLMEKHRGDFGAVFKEFTLHRKPDMDAMADMSMTNFAELEKSPDPNYDTKWMLERKLWDLLPDRWMPQYAMIAFSHIPLSEVEVRSKLQMRILDELVTRYSIEELENDNRLKEIVSGQVTALSVQ
jgi:kynurenine 3-monooxygenase